MEVKFNDLTKKFGNFTAVDHLTMTMTNGVYGLLGVNGAGKTTMMRMLCTLLKPTRGSITCNGKDGIPDLIVTGVQTCALPILHL